MDLLADELSGLCAGRFPLSFIAPRPLYRGFLRHCPSNDRFEKGNPGATFVWRHHLIANS
jgi:hypothetical protein